MLTTSTATHVLRHARRQAPGADPTRGIYSSDFTPMFRFAHTAPSHAPVEGAALADDIAALIARYLPATPAHVTALTLWALHAWAHEASESSPRLALVSPEPRTGKTTALRLLALLTPRPLLLASAHAPTLVHVIDRFRPTLLIDDAEASVLARRDLRALLTLGFACDGQVLSRGAHMGALPTLSCATPVAFATSQTLPRAIAERAIALTFHPANTSDEGTEGEGAAASRARLPLHAPPEECASIRAKAARFAVDRHATLAAAAPQMPNALARGARENWRPLFAIADALSPAWSARAREAACLIAAASPATATTTELLADIRAAFERVRETRLTTADLIATLTGETDSPWVAADRGRKLNPRTLALRLEPLGIRPRTLRTAEGFHRGYIARDFAAAFDAYLGAAPRAPEEIF